MQPFSEFAGKIIGMDQKFVSREGGPAKTILTMKIEIQEGAGQIGKLAEVLNYPVDFNITPVQGGIIK